MTKNIPIALMSLSITLINSVALYSEAKYWQYEIGTPVLSFIHSLLKNIFRIEFIYQTYTQI